MPTDSIQAQKVGISNSKERKAHSSFILLSLEMP